jgi:hypothetical protein
VDEPEDNFLKPFCQEFSYQLNRRIKQGDRPEISNSRRVVTFGDKGNEGRVYALEAQISSMEVLTQLVKIPSDQRPTLLEEFTIEPIWAR